MIERKDNATDANCEMDTERYDGPSWGILVALALGAFLWIFAAIGFVVVLQVIIRGH